MKNHLARLRSERNWSQGDLAERLGVSRQTINAIERGRYDPSLPLAFRIAALFVRRIEDIFEADGPADEPAGRSGEVESAPGGFRLSDER